MLRIPGGVPPHMLSEFLEKHESFLKERLETASRRSSSLADAISGSGTLGILGWECSVETARVPRGTAPSISIEGEGRAVLLARRGSDPVSELRLALSSLCESAASHEASRISTAIGKSPSSIRAGRWGSRWGACDSLGNVTLDWRCVLLPSRLFAHVVAHECCHLVHMDHSKNFRRLLSSIRPEAESESSELASLRDTLPC